jgi:hypothetical protein
MRRNTVFFLLISLVLLGAATASVLLLSAFLRPYGEEPSKSYYSPFHGPQGSAVPSAQEKPSRNAPHDRERRSRPEILAATGDQELHIEISEELSDPGSKRKLASLMKILAKRLARPDEAIARLIDRARQSGDYTALRVELSELLRKNPGLCRAACLYFSREKDPHILFQIAQALSPYAKADVLDHLMLQAIEGDEIHREMAVYGLMGSRDPRVRHHLVDTFLSVEAPDGVRQACAFALADHVPEIPPSKGIAIREEARRIASYSSSNELRGRAIDLLSSFGPLEEHDKRLARHILAREQEPRLLISAAKALLLSGAPPRSVIPSLERVAATPGNDFLKPYIAELRNLPSSPQ